MCARKAKVSYFYYPWFDVGLRNVTLVDTWTGVAISALAQAVVSANFARHIPLDCAK